MSGLLQVAPLLGGMLLLIICFINILRVPQISNANALLLALGALLFVVPAANFQISFPGMSVSTQSIGKQLVVQGADTNLGLADIKQALTTIASKLNTTVPTVAAKASPAQVVLVFYVENQLTLALKVQNFLLQNGYAANVALTDFSEVKDQAKGQAGTARLVYVTKLQNEAQSLLNELKGQFHDTSWSDASNENLSAAGMEIKIF